MALSTYNDLVASVTGHLRRGDLTVQIPDFIRMGEARLNRLLRLLQQETTESLTASTSVRTLALPSRFLELISLTLDCDPLVPLGADQMDEAISAESGKPKYYRIGAQIEFERVPDQAYTVKVRMLKRWALQTDTTNWLMVNCPDCYIYASLLAASPYIKDDSRLLTWREMLSAAIEEANELDSRTRADTVLTIDPGLAGGGSFDIVRGE